MSKMQCNEIKVNTRQTEWEGERAKQGERENRLPAACACAACNTLPAPLPLLPYLLCQVPRYFVAPWLLLLIFLFFRSFFFFFFFLHSPHSWRICGIVPVPVPAAKVHSLVQLCLAWTKNMDAWAWWECSRGVWLIDKHSALGTN